MAVYEHHHQQLLRGRLDHCEESEQHGGPSKRGDDAEDARNCVLILTTNLGAKNAEKNTIGFTDSMEKEYEDTELKKFFSPEFRNRLDGVITFAKLGKPVMMKIVGKFLKELKDMVAEKGLI